MCAVSFRKSWWFSARKIVYICFCFFLCLWCYRKLLTFSYVFGFVVLFIRWINLLVSAFMFDSSLLFDFMVFCNILSVDFKGIFDSASFHGFLVSRVSVFLANLFLVIIFFIILSRVVSLLLHRFRVCNIRFSLFKSGFFSWILAFVFGLIRACVFLWFVPFAFVVFATFSHISFFVDGLYVSRFASLICKNNPILSCFLNSMLYI
jgi:hypothetical protein